MKNYLNSDHDKPIFTLDAIIMEFYPNMDERLVKKNLKFQKLLFRAKNKAIIDRITLENFLNKHSRTIDAWKVLNSRLIYFTSNQKKDILDGKYQLGILECDSLDLDDILIISKYKGDSGFNLVGLIAGCRTEVINKLASER